MALIEVPVRRDLSAHTERVELDGVIYTVSLRWNSRMARWVLDLAAADGTPALLGLVLVADYAINLQFAERRRANVPEGFLFVIDTTDQGLEPDLVNLGQEVKLFYLEAAA